MKNNQLPEVRFPEFKDAWEQRMLGEVINDQYNGQTPSRANDSFWNGNINWLSSGELNRATVFETVEKITEEGKRDANLKMIPKDTFVMAITGLEAAGTRGNCAILGMDTTLNQSCMALFPNQNLLNSLFLFQWYRNIGEEYGLLYTQGTKQQSYNAKLIKILPIILPSVREQIQIAEFFDKIDNTITLHQRKLDLLKEQKKGFLQKMFPKNGQAKPKIRFSGFTDDWELRKLGEEADVRDGTHDSPKYFNMGHPLVTSKNLKSHGLDLTDISLISDNDFDAINRRSKVDKGDILFGMIGTIGNPVLVERDDFAIKNVALIKEQKNVLNRFLIQLLKSPIFDRYIKIENAGGTQKFLALSKIRLFKFMVPSLEEQTRIARFLDELDNAIALHQRELEILKNTKKAFLQKMFV